MTKARGVVFIYVLGVLFILAMLGTTFLSRQTLGKRVAQNHTNEIRARLMAQSGLDEALERLRAARWQNGPNDPTVYWGDVNDETGPPDLKVPIEEATNPSFAIEAASLSEAFYNPYTSADPTPQKVWINGRPRGVSTTLATGTYGDRSDTSTLRVTGTQGRININDGVHEDGRIHRPVTANLERILNALGSQMPPSLELQTLGETLVDNRPVGGWRSKRALMGVLSARQYKAVRPFVTAHSWIDPNVSLPVPLSTDAGALGLYPPHARPPQLDPDGQLWRGSPPSCRRGRNKDWLGDTVDGALSLFPAASIDAGEIRVYGLDELNPTWIEVTRRAPVSVNEAPKEVLVALLADLQGFFLLEGRKHFPNTTTSGTYGMAGGYVWLQTYHTYSPEGMRPFPNYSPWTVEESDEIGRLYATLPIRVTPASNPTVAISAATIADEIIACRSRQATTHFDYGDPAAGFAGPFRTWRQFHAFCDNLAEIGLLDDARTCFRDFAPDMTGWQSYFANGALQTSELQQRIAAQAVADVLKANFNPNLHLNELNPDANLFLHVDKTDLIVQSTEFSLTPSGTYEIESLGRVLRPIGGSDALTAPDNELMAECKITAIVRLFDQFRETHQKHFSAGTMGGKATALPRTNNNRSVEAGPEPDNGPAPGENEWSGNVALPTIGGTGVEGPPGAIKSTPFGDDDALGSALHGHFAWDDQLHHHVNGPSKCVDLANHSVPGEGVTNFAAPGETLPRPYMPGPDFRLARAVRITPGQSQPALPSRAPLDLRIDGIYSERHSAPAWWLSKDVWPDPIRQWRVRLNGVAGTWMKPSFFPETTWKTRVFLNASLSPHLFVPFGFQHVFAPAHDASPFAASQTEDPLPFYLNAIPPASFLFGFNHAGVATGSLNHEAHNHATPRRSALAAHRWVHVVLRWKELSGSRTRWDIYVNGVLEGSYTQRPLAHAVWSDATPKWVGWSRRNDGSRNSIRLGSPSRVQASPGLRYKAWSPWDLRVESGDPAFAHRLQHSADATFDEFYVWGHATADEVDDSFQKALSLWQLGRYYVPTATDGVFTSREIPLPVEPVRWLPPASTVAPPGPVDVSVAFPDPSRSIRLIGMAWTLIGEALDSSGNAVVWDFQTDTPESITARVEMTLRVDGTDVTPAMTDGGFSAVRNVKFDPDQAFQYRARFRLDGADLNSILLATPVLDDVTIFYTTGTKFLEMRVE